MRTLPFALALSLVACGGDELGLDDSDLEADAAVPVDAGKDADAGQPVVDAGAPPVVDKCSAGQGAGTYSNGSCWTAAELASHGCTLGTKGVNPTSTTIVITVEATASQVASTRWTLVRSAPRDNRLYLCSSAPPTVDWQCGAAQGLANCQMDWSSGTTTVSCEKPKYQLPAMPMQQALCSD